MGGLKYKILWVDDNITDFEDLLVDKELEDYLESLGFEAVLHKFEAAEDALNVLRTNNKYDLILSDLNLNGGENGDSLINKIRAGEIYTEILFYSGKTDFEDVARKLYTDRVSFFSLAEDTAFREFKKKIFLLIDLTISKLQELDNVRGLVMSETSILDNSIEELLLEILTSSSQHVSDIKNYIYKQVKDSYEEKGGQIERMLHLSESELVENRLLLDASKKARALNKYIKVSRLDQSDHSLADFYANYDKDVIKVRNDLAHAKSQIIDSVECLIVKRNGQTAPDIIDQNKCVGIRKNLRKYSALLAKIKDNLNAQA